MHPVRTLDRFLNGITMYRLLLYGLRVLAIVAFALAFLGELPFSVWAMLASLAAVVAGCYATNWVLARVWRVASNSESYIITALILFFILPPAATPTEAAAVFLAGVVAMASKYLLTWHRRNIFNPAAIAAVAVSLFGVLDATWWIGSKVLLPFTLLLGLLLVRKLRRFWLIAAFLVASGALTVAIVLTRSYDLGANFKLVVLSSPLVFFASVMLTEPATMPPRQRARLVYAVLIGLIFASQTHVGSISSTPEIALVVGNVFAFLASPGRTVRLRFKHKTRLGPGLYDFVFAPTTPAPDFLPGQYAAWTLPVARPDDRGNRRTFTIASSPTEGEVRIGVKIPETSSAFKWQLLALQPGAVVDATQIAGDFTLPADFSKKLVFIAGGIGITPFRSMLKYMIDTKQRRDIVLFYAVASSKELVYGDVLAQAAAQGVRIVQVLTHVEPEENWEGRRGFLTQKDFAEEVPDFAERTFYLSGPNAMVENYQTILRAMGVPRRRIVSDYFSGY